MRNRIALMRELPTDGMTRDQIEERNKKIIELEQSLNSLKNSENFKKISEDYWAGDSVQVSAMCDLLQQIGVEAERVEESLEQAAKLRKSEVANRLETRKTELEEDMERIFAFVSQGRTTGPLVQEACERWEKLKGAKMLAELLSELMEKGQDESSEISKKIEIEKKRLERLERESRGAQNPELENLRASFKELERKDDYLKREIKRRKEKFASTSAAIPVLSSELRARISKLYGLSRSAQQSNSSKSVRSVLLASSIPYVRAMVEAAASKLPRQLLVKRQDLTVENFESARAEFERIVIKAKSRSRCKRCREMIDSLLSGAVDPEAPGILECKRLLEEGDITQARKALQKAFDNGEIHEYVRSDLEAAIKDLVAIYDSNGEVSRAEEKLKKAGSEMFFTRLDIMRLDYIMSGVHSSELIWQAAAESLVWLTSLGVVFQESTFRVLADSKDNPEFSLLSNTKGFSSEQSEAFELLGNALKAESELMGRLGASETAKKIIGTEVKIASIVTATEHFSNPLYLKEVMAGEKNSNEIRDTLLENAGEYAGPLKLYLETSMRTETIEAASDSLGALASDLAKAKSLCLELDKLKASASKGKSGEALSSKLTLNRKSKELEELVARILGSQPDENLLALISNQKLFGQKLYSAIIRNPSVIKAVGQRIGEQRKALNRLTSAKPSPTRKSQLIDSSS